MNVALPYKRRLDSAKRNIKGIYFQVVDPNETQTVQLDFDPNLSLNIEYSINGAGFAPYTDGTQITFTGTDKVYFRGINNKLSSSQQNVNESLYSNFKFSNPSVLTRCDGNLGHLINYNTIEEYGNFYKFCFYCLFRDLVGLYSAPYIPKNLGNDYGTFKRLFKGCTTLVELQNDELYSNSFNEMFYGCSSLIDTPTITIPKLMGGALQRMFYHCSSLKSVGTINISDTNMYGDSCESMFEGCSNLKSATIPRLGNGNLNYGGHYRYMFKDCTSLESVVISSVKNQLGGSDCAGMFFNCSSLKNVTFSFSGTIRDRTFQSMFEGCSNLESINGNINITGFNAKGIPGCRREFCNRMFYGCSKLLSVNITLPNELENAGCKEMFRNCSKLNQAFILPATTAYEDCYRSMFNGCSSLSTPPIIQLTTLAKYCCYYMFERCTSLTIAPELKALNYAPDAYTGIFKNCSNIAEIKMAVTNYISSNEFSKGVAANGTFYKNANANWNVNGETGIPTNWTVVTYTPS